MEQIFVVFVVYLGFWTSIQVDNANGNRPPIT
jgi:hypothetical protein